MHMPHTIPLCRLVLIVEHDRPSLASRLVGPSRRIVRIKGDGGGREKGKGAVGDIGE